jgi:alpha-N-arabinofuranosidase
MGFRQKENNFEYSAKMNFSPNKNGAEAGISIFQQDDNYINFTMTKSNGTSVLQLVVKGRKEELKTVKQKTLKEYDGEIIFKLVSKNNQYQYLYSLDGGTSFTHFAETSNDLVLCYGYIGTNLGIYATSNGKVSKEYADFDWVNYKGFPDY